MSLSDENMSSSDEEDYPTPSEAGDNLERILIDRLGDLTLCVGPHLKQYQICSRTVARASPVFMRMLNGNFVEARPSSGDWVINLPDDASKSMKLFLDITHGNFGSVPRTLSIRGLYDLVVLLDKYDALEVIRPWAGAWVEDVSHDLQQPALLYIASELGDAQLFQKVLFAFAEEWIITSQGELMYQTDFYGADPPPIEYREMIWVPGHPLRVKMSGLSFPLDLLNMRLSEFDGMFTAAREVLRKFEFDPYIELFEAARQEEYAMSQDTDQHIDAFTRRLISTERTEAHSQCGAHICFTILLNFRNARFGIPTRDECKVPDKYINDSVFIWKENMSRIIGRTEMTISKGVNAGIGALECSACRGWAQQLLERRREHLAAGCISQDYLIYLGKRAAKTGFAVMEMSA